MLALGDVDFVERPDAGDEEALTDLSEPSRPRLEAAARLLDVSADKILHSLTSRKINAGISNQVCTCKYVCTVILLFFAFLRFVGCFEVETYSSVSVFNVMILRGGTCCFEVELSRV